MIAAIPDRRRGAKPRAPAPVRLAALAVTGVLAGCQVTPVAESPPPTDWAAAVAPSSPTSGAIYQPTYYSPLFENPTARRAGDLVTIRLVERTIAAKSATTATSKATSVAIPSPTIAGRPITAGGYPVFETDIDSKQAFNGKGDSQQSNRLDGSITATVVGRLPNGNLVVRGEKWLQLNQGREFVRLEGIVRPIDIERDNSVASWKVADAKISYGGRGALEDANSMGWLARFFNSPLFPF